MKIPWFAVGTAVLVALGVWIVYDILSVEYQICETAWSTAANYTNSDYCKYSPITAKIPEHLATCNKYEGAAKVTTWHCFTKKVLDMIGAKLNPSKEEWINSLLNFAMIGAAAYWFYWLRVNATANDTKLKAYREMIELHKEQAKSQIAFQREQATQRLALEQNASFSQQAMMATYMENLAKVAKSKDVTPAIEDLDMMD